ncbi:MAG: HNH endonuclease [Coriobacteriales bacterium]|nr:HNH endonuclease [Coriobacteriales bacterium]
MRHRWTDEERGFLRGAIPGRWRAEVCAAFEERFGRPVTQAQVKEFASCHRVLSGVRGTPPGSPSERTRFGPGHVPHNRRPIGSEEWRLGYLWRKVAETRPSRLGWAPVHRLVWEEAHGPVPQGCEVAFCDGDRTRIEPGNLMLITGAEHAVMARRGLFGAGEAGRACADLAIAASRRRREAGGR